MENTQAIGLRLGRQHLAALDMIAHEMGVGRSSAARRMLEGAIRERMVALLGSPGSGHPDEVER